VGDLIITTINTKVINNFAIKQVIMDFFANK